MTHSDATDHLAKQVKNDKKMGILDSYFNVRRYKAMMQRANSTNPNAICHNTGPCDDLHYRKSIVAQYGNQTTIQLNWYQWIGIGVSGTDQKVQNIVTQLQKLFSPHIKLDVRVESVKLNAEVLTQYNFGCGYNYTCLSIARATRKLLTQREVPNTNWRQKPNQLFMHIAPLMNPDVGMYLKSNNIERWFCFSSF